MSWITPLGLPVTQPYRKEAHYAVKTVLQNVILTLYSVHARVHVHVHVHVHDL